MNHIATPRPGTPIAAGACLATPVDVQQDNFLVTSGNLYLTIEAGTGGSPCLCFNPNPTRFPIIKDIRARKWEIYLPGSPETPKATGTVSHKRKRSKTTQTTRQKVQVLYTDWDLSQIITKKAST